MNLKRLLYLLENLKCTKVYIKTLSPNDHSKRQVYFGTSFEALNIFPIQAIITDSEGIRKSETFKSKLHFCWLTEDGNVSLAPNAQLILYPDYPEVRFSGFLKNSKDAPSKIMNSKVAGRLLFLGINNLNQVIGYVVYPESELANEANSLKGLPELGVFKEITINDGKIESNSKEKLLFELVRIHRLGWITSKRLNANHELLPCNSPNCGGYTLEAELGISPNGFSRPDYLGWEIKQFNVPHFKKFNSAIVTLMTPEPTHGYYIDSGVESFIYKYGYADKKGREARLNFGGIYRHNVKNKLTGLTLIIDGYETDSGKFNLDGNVALIDQNDIIAASWSFRSLLEHWLAKHAKACYVPSMQRQHESVMFNRQYYYGDHVILGTVTDFLFFLRNLHKGDIYYDPAIKLEQGIPGMRKQKIKRRSQFRVKSGKLQELYQRNEIIDLINYESRTR